MAKKSTRKTPTFKQPMGVDDAQERLERQIAAGEEILSERPSSLQELGAMQNRVNRWESASINSLYAITDDDSLKEVYEKEDVPFGGMFGGDLDVGKELKVLRFKLRCHIQKLREILAGLPGILSKQE